MEHKIAAFERKLTKVITPVVAIELIVATAIVFIITFARYFFNVSWEWTEELLRYLIISSAFIASGPMVYKETHIVMDFFSGRIKDAKLLCLFKIYSAVCILICSIILFYWGLLLTREAIAYKMKTYSLIFPQALPYSIIPISMSVLVVYCILKIAVTIAAGSQVNDKGTSESAIERAEDL